MKVIIRPQHEPQREVDLTGRLVSAIAEELWRLYGGNDQLNWLEAECHLQEIVAEARADAAEDAMLTTLPPVRRPLGSRSECGTGVIGGHTYPVPRAARRDDSWYRGRRTGSGRDDAWARGAGIPRARQAVR